MFIQRTIMRKATRFLKSPDIDKIPLPTSRIRQIFYKRINPISDFGELKTPHKEDDLNSYHQLIERFDFPADIQQTWSHFINRKPSEIWSGPYNSFLFAHSKITQDFYYLHDPRAVSLHEGMQSFTLFRLSIPLTIIAMEII
ncbi:MAG: hypothetical protein R3C61_18840 [Bacteroidia bacterium]